MKKLLTISDLARELGITQRTIRFYEEQGLILPERAGERRVYSARDRARLILILRGKQLGFSLRDIAEYLDLYDADPLQQAQTRALLDKARERIRALEEQLAALRVTLGELRGIEKMALEALRRLDGNTD